MTKNSTRNLSTDSRVEEAVKNSVDEAIKAFENLAKELTIAKSHDLSGYQLTTSSSIDFGNFSSSGSLHVTDNTAYIITTGSPFESVDFDTPDRPDRDRIKEALEQQEKRGRDVSAVIDLLLRIRAGRVIDYFSSLSIDSDGDSSYAKSANAIVWVFGARATKTHEATDRDLSTIASKILFEDNEYLLSRFMTDLGALRTLNSGVFSDMFNMNSASYDNPPVDDSGNVIDYRYEEASLWDLNMVRGPILP